MKAEVAACSSAPDLPIPAGTAAAAGPSPATSLLLDQLKESLSTAAPAAAVPQVKPSKTAAAVKFCGQLRTAALSSAAAPVAIIKHAVFTLLVALAAITQSAVIRSAAFKALTAVLARNAAVPSDAPLAKIIDSVLATIKAVKAVLLPRPAVASATSSFCADLDHDNVSPLTVTGVDAAASPMDSGMLAQHDAAVSALYTLCALLPRNADLHALLQADPDFLPLLVHCLQCSHEDLVRAAAWCIHCLVTECAAFSALLVDLGALPACVAAMGTVRPPAAAIVCWALRALSNDNATVKTALLELGAVPLVGGLFGVADMPARAASVWLIGTMAAGFSAAQDAMTPLINAIVALFRDVSSAVVDQAIVAVYNIAMKHPGNQECFVIAGVIEILTGLFPVDVAALPRLTEKLGASLIAVVSRYPPGQQRAVACKPLITKLRAMMQCDNPTLQTVACGLVRTQTNDNAEVQSCLVAHGVLAELLPLCGSADPFVREQACIALSQLMSREVANLYALATHDTIPLFTRLLRDTKSTSSTYLATLMTLNRLIDAVAPYKPALMASPGFDALKVGVLRLAHQHCPCAPIQEQAERLLELIVPPEVFANRTATAAGPILDNLLPLPDDAAAAISCCVCQCEGGDMRTLPCLHTFHYECIREWVSRHDACPTCRTPVCGHILRMTMVEAHAPGTS